MGLRQKEWARRWRDILRRLLGGVCRKCGRRRKLTFDVIHPVGVPDHHRKMDWSQRISFYRKMYDAGNLQLLCSVCNEEKSNKLELVDYAVPEVKLTKAAQERDKLLQAS